jgi:hypothetical protein
MHAFLRGTGRNEEPLSSFDWRLLGRGDEMKKAAAPEPSVDEVQEIAKTPPGRETYIRNTDRAVMVEITPHCYLNVELLAFVGRGRIT